MAKSRNLSLNKAKDTKNDEFYTQISDIEKELKHYRDHFKGATVLCNCDDPEWSNFWKYFHLNFEFLGLKKLITTHYDPTEPTYKMEYEGGSDEDLSAGVITPLKTNGDFRSPECIELLEEASIVVTNPPFSLFREYLAQLVNYKKNFIIIGSMNALTCKEVFQFIQNDLVWLGFNQVKEFRQPDGSIKKFGNILWYTNLDITKRHETLDMTSHYTPEHYPKYCNYDAINVDKIVDIPDDYYGVMGVPFSFLEKHNPDQFEIIGYDGNDFVEVLGFDIVGEEWIDLYRSQGGTGHITANMHSLVLNIDGKAKTTYKRLLIRRKDVTGNEN